MSGFANPIIGGDGTLVYPAIHSPGFVTGVSGWSINRDDTAEFNNLVIRGTIFGTDYIINPAGIFFYSGTPGTSNPPGTFAKVGGLIQSMGANITINPVNVGDLVLLHCISNGSAPPSGVAGGNCNWSQVGTTFSGTVNNGLIGAVFAGTATATGSAVATVSYTGTPSTIRNAAQEFTSSTGLWSLVTQANLDSAGTNTMPTINTTVTGQLYSIFEFDNVATTAGATSGYFYEIDANGNALVFNPNCGIGAQAPTLGDSTSAFGIAVLMSAPPAVAGSSLIVAITNAAGTDPFGNPVQKGITVGAGVISGATISVGDTITLDQNGISVYNGAALPGNLQVTISPSGAITTKAPIVFQPVPSTPAADPNKGATAYSANGNLQVVDGTDQQAYGVQRRTIVSGDQVCNSTGFATFFSSPVAGPANSSRRYHVHARININPNQAAGGFACQIVCAAASGGVVDMIWFDATNGAPAARAPVAFIQQAFSASLQPGFVMTAAHTYCVDIEAVFTMAANTSDNFTIQFAETVNGDAYTIKSGSFIELMPV